MAEQDQYQIQGQPQQFASLAPRFVGSDVSPAQNSLQPTALPNAQTQGFGLLEQGGKYLQGAAEYESKNAQQRQQLIGDAQQAVGQSIAASAESAMNIAKYRQATGQTNAFETLTKAVGAIFEQQQKQKAAEAKSAQQKEYMQAFLETQQLKTAYREKGLDENGLSAYQKDLISTIGKYKNLDSEQVTKLIDDGYSVALQYATEKSHKQQDFIEKTQSQLRDAATVKAQLQINGTLAKIKYDPYGDVDALQEELSQQIGNILDTPGLDPLTAATIANSAMKSTLDAVQENSKAAVMLNRQISAVNEYAQFAVESNQRVEQGADPNQEKILRQQKRLELGVPGNFDDPTPFASRKMVQEGLEAEDTIARLHEQGAIRAAEKATFNQDAASYLAWSIINNPGTLEQLKVNKTLSASSTVRTAIQLAEEYQKGDTERKRIQLQMQSAREEFAQAEKGNVLWFIDQAQRGNPSVTEQIQAQQLGLPPAGQKLTPEQQAKAQQAYDNYKQELANRLRILQDQFGATNNRLIEYGLVGSRDEISTRMQQRRGRYESFVNQFNDLIQRQQTETPGAASPFNAPSVRRSNVGGKTPTNFLTTKYQGKTVRMPFESNAAGVSMLNNYGEQRESHQHAGEDIPVPIGTPIVSPVSGKVARIEVDPSGYGHYMDVIGSDGMLYRYAHLQPGALFKRVGQEVRAGDRLARSGNSGRSSGAHLHFEVRDPNKLYGIDGTVNPLNYLASVGAGQSKANKPRTLSDGSHYLPTGAIPTAQEVLRNHIPKDALPLPGGYYINGGKLGRYQSPVQRPVEQVYSGVAPIRSSTAPRDRRAYPGKNDPSANYGYSVLAQDRSFARGVAGLSDRLGIPAQWLVDVMAFETGGSFHPGVPNQGGSGAVGLIQFMPETAASLGTSPARLAQMSRTQQLNYVEKYFSSFKKSDLQKSPEMVLAAVWGGQGLIDAINKRGLEAVKNDPNWSDGDITFGDYVKRLGKPVGRQYSDRAAKFKPIHTTFRQGCPVCASLKAAGSPIIAHEAN